MLLHAMRSWPEIITKDLWPFALKLAVDIHISTPGPSGLSPDEIFSGQKSTKNRLTDFHTFGCPVFVLDFESGLPIFLQYTTCIIVLKKNY